ncbi:23S rRNA (adenine(2503)-C(2))-methyltransferase RlmN [Holophaga foetida]|uniref:23S rRNA (adenine(2503)-C(2))-methyltransferase RlmN n=1 Tax=Holophaga foetida TaxID=35839 RepID=UPI0002475009|nr:23S rRNA (adenine(2503)-C(2))-methyltransferase RlmN [Holophaga foetida]
MNWDQPAPELASGGRPNVAGACREALKALVAGLGEKPFRAAQLFEGLYVHRWTRWDQFSTLSKALRERLEAEVDLAWPAIQESRTAEDGATKHAFLLGDGQQVEGVHMPYADRTTLCISSQVGCAMGCTFCATGQMGIRRNLSAAEIVGQVVVMLNQHRHPEGRPVNLVFMGMGEPLHNLAQVMGAFEILTDPKGLAIPPRRITLSTSGLVPGIRRLGSYERRPRLAVSLNATTDAYRDRIMPVNRAWNLAALAEALRAFPLAKGERITLEYVLLRGVTDSREDADRLAAYARALPSKVNLIPFNEHEGAGYQAPEEGTLDLFCRILTQSGVAVMIRRSRGQEVGGACGQLVKREPELEGSKD